MPPIDVDDPAALIRELKSQNAGRTIQLKPGTYQVGVPLLVPDGATLRGAGVMQPEQGLPVKFKPGTTTTITARDRLVGNLVTLSDGSAVRGLVLQGAPPPAPP